MNIIIRCVIILILTASHSKATPADSLIHELDTMKVSTLRPHNRQIIDIKRNEQIIGQGDDLNTLIALEPTIARIPEAGSLLLVKGGGPYDNLFLLRDVPVFNPGHFGGHTFADRSIIGLGVPVNVEMIDENVAGRYSGASGSVFSFDPQTVPFSKGIQRPELMINYGSLGADLSLGMPFRGGSDRYHLSLHAADRVLIGAIGRTNFPLRSDNAGSISPSSYDDFQIQGTQQRSRYSIEELIWLSSDLYWLDNGSNTPVEIWLPWGIGALTIKDTSVENPWRLTIGGSRQHYFQGKQMGTIMPVVHVERSNGSLLASLPPAFFGPGTLRTRVSIEYVYSCDTLTHYVSRAFSPVLAYENTIDTIARSHRSGIAATHFGYGGYMPFGRYELNLNAGVFIAGMKPFVDPGVSMEIPFAKGTLTINGGMVSAQPDIRGLPSHSFQQQTSHTWSGTVGIQQSPTPWLSGRIQGYVKHRDRVPVEINDPAMPVWDEQAQGSLISYGAGARLDIAIGKEMHLTTIQNMSASFIRRDGLRTPYRWEVPWNNTTILSAKLLNRNMTAYLIGNFSDGVPYRDVKPSSTGTPQFDDHWKRTPVYQCIDFKIEHSQQIDGYPFLRQLDAYVLIDNILEASTWIDNRATWSMNVREYYYDTGYRKYPVTLKPLGGHIGLRAHFRL